MEICLWSHNLIWLWALRILFLLNLQTWQCWFHTKCCWTKSSWHIWARLAFNFNDVSYNYDMWSNLRKETGKEGSCRKVGRFPPKHYDRYFFVFGPTLFLTKLSMTTTWYIHFSNSFQSYHQWWSVNFSSVSKKFPRSQFYLRFFTLLYFTVAPHSPHNRCTGYQPMCHWLF